MSTDIATLKEKIANITKQWENNVIINRGRCMTFTEELRKFIANHPQIDQYYADFLHVDSLQCNWDILLESFYLKHNIKIDSRPTRSEKSQDNYYFQMELGFEGKNVDWTAYSTFFQETLANIDSQITDMIRQIDDFKTFQAKYINAKGNSYFPNNYFPDWSYYPTWEWETLFKLNRLLKQPFEEIPLIDANKEDFISAYQQATRFIQLAEANALLPVYYQKNDWFKEISIRCSPIRFRISFDTTNTIEYFFNAHSQHDALKDLIETFKVIDIKRELDKREEFITEKIDLLQRIMTKTP